MTHAPEPIPLPPLSPEGRARRERIATEATSALRARVRRRRIATGALYIMPLAIVMLFARPHLQHTPPSPTPPTQPITQRTSASTPDPTPHLKVTTSPIERTLAVHVVTHEPRLTRTLPNGPTTVRTLNDDQTVAVLREIAPAAGIIRRDGQAKIVGLPEPKDTPNHTDSPGASLPTRNPSQPAA